MLLKRHYKRDAKGALIEPPQVDHLEVKHTGIHAAQHFSTRLVAAGIAEGWLTIEGGQLFLKAKPEPLRYTVKRVPGRYPKADAPGGAEVINYYECELDPAQHQKFAAQKGGARG